MRLTRRGFLMAAVAGVAAAVTGCSRGSDERPHDSLVGVEAEGSAPEASTDDLGGVRELVELDVDEEGLMRLDDAHVSPDPATATGSARATRWPRTAPSTTTIASTTCAVTSRPCEMRWMTAWI